MRSLSGLMDRFRRDQRGNFAMIFAIVLVPLLTFLGAAIDYGRATRARATMQSVLDSVSLMVAKDLSSGLITTSQVTAKAQSYFNALYTDSEAQGVNISATYTQASGSTAATVLVTGSASISTDFMQLAGFNTMPFQAASTSTWGSSLLRVALVLDNTGSMAQYGKMAALQPAAKNLVTQLSALAQNQGDVYISVVPFEVNVNVGSFNGVSNTNASWLRWDQWDPSNTDSKGRSYCSQSIYSWFARAECSGHGYHWGDTSPSTNKSLWKGCVSDRDQNYDVSATVPTSLTTNFPANQESYCPAAAVLPLTYDWTTVNNTINAMSPNGGTNQTIGLLWGWLSLLQQSPLNAPSENPNNQYQHIIILFTDGLNTADRWYGDGSNTSTQVDSRMTTLCSAIKATGVTIYTVQIDTDGSGPSAVLPACASGPGNFFMLTNANQINSAFAAIGTSIAELRVAK
ncbi:MAG: pilus assembly protein [Bradyrhizobium sp.]|uniref:TadE/TadG family type IV pilus assembly protein n=1 Tax=Bradyrhizobium sp. TaxID=376 RepID=UPI001C281B3F|nr:TadE/TadG family type IV pilus assembly protein [Bradyrhizobium sp.]MBU6463051.1 pilus assembly protein [Pseudomonadota bacterium]MDE2069251.1 pilus assembly protein [Bradyrhizobium sp.]MDE2242246.1 pilus assembly protein [Bradyrhizobium sp.]MDE2468543.1 pilus assembly protein [Bradyrhizobium sp.]